MRSKFIYKIPHSLLYSRLVVAIMIICFSFLKIHPLIIVGLSIYAILSDVLDGIIARRLNISTKEMRKMDTKIDTVFWFSCLFYICVNHPHFLSSHVTQVLILVFSEFIIIAFGFLKFRERISYHTILSKFWALILLWFLIDLVLTGNSHFSFGASFWYGILVQSEILLITIILKKPQTDVPGLFQAMKLKRGVEISRNRLFNG